MFPVRIGLTTFIVTSALLLGASPGFAQGDAEPFRLTSELEKRVHIPRTGTRPTLDGVLDDAAWAQAATIEDLHQYEPVDHGEPSERTVVYVVYDDEYLYVAARMWDREPTEIRARQMVQGQDMWFDDSFNVLLDPFNNKRTGYRFQVNPNGTRTDSVFETPTEDNDDWEGIWHAEARINDEGWAVELEIPFKTLNFDPSNPDWGFSAWRSIARRQESIAWTSFNRRVDPGSTGVITGLTDLQQGAGLDVVPTIVTSQEKDFETGLADSDIAPSLDVFYNFTPSLTGVLTLNTDYSATEVDDRQINLSRFSLFFPEKRDFFLQDVDIFSFGGLDRNGSPFHSRRIGLGDSGQPVDLEVGAKLTGRVGRWNVGVLDIQQDGFQGKDGYVSSSNAFVGRIAANILEESSVGMIFTDGDPQSNLGNSLAGFDFRYRNTNLPGGKALEGELWYQQSDTEGVDTDQDAWGLRLASPNQEGVFALGSYDTFGSNFNPALGFVNRVGIERYDVRGGYNHRPLNHPWLRNLGTDLGVEEVSLISGGLESRGIFFSMLEVENHAGDELGLVWRSDREVLYEAFEIADGVVIPTGDYEFDRMRAEVGGAEERAFAPNLELEKGEFFGGEILSAQAGIEWRPNRHLFFGVEYQYNDIELPGGDLITQLIQVDLNLAFNVRWSWVNLIQYDNESGSVGINSRLRWNPRAGQDLYFVLNHDFDAIGAFRGLRSAGSQVSLKYTHTFRL